MPENYTYHIACSGLAASGAVSSAISSITTGVCEAKINSKEWTAAITVAAGALSGGITAKIAGGDFWEGVCNGLISSGLNHALHLVVEGGGKLIKAQLKNLENFNHIKQSDYWNRKPTRCKYACLQMVENYFFGDSGRTESELLGKGLGFESKDAVITFCKRMANNGENHYFANAVDDYTPTKIAKCLEAGFPIMMIEWNGADAHSSLIIGVNELSAGDFELQIADPLDNDSFRKEIWNDMTSSKKTSYQLILFSK